MWNPKLPKLPGLPDFQTLLLFFLTVGFLINSMALYYKEHYPWVVIYNPMTNIAKLVKATRDEQAVLDVMLGGFRQAVAMATGSHPFEMDRAGHYAIRAEILDQMFAPDAARYVRDLREQIAIFQVYGAIELTFNNTGEVVITPARGGLYLEAYFNQVIPIGENRKRIRTFHAQAFGHLAPGTLDNPYQIKFVELKIKEIQPKKPRE